MSWIIIASCHRVTANAVLAISLSGRRGNVQVVRGSQGGTEDVDVE